MARENNNEEVKKILKDLEERLQKAEAALKDVLDGLKWAEDNENLKIMPECKHYDTSF